MAQEKSMTLTLQLQEKLPHIIGDSHELGQVFLNLLTNATKYGFENSAINVTVNLIEDGKEELGEHHARIVVSVTDEGEGIEEKHIPRLTERFYRVDKARSRKVGGTGLGLCIVKHILNRHQGELSIKSTVGKGSTFSVFLPVPSDE
jgi:two-component system phosphate regulon sensor histidine kinase PhoR